MDLGIYEGTYLTVFFIVILIACLSIVGNIMATIGNSISLYHSLNTEKRDTCLIAFSAIGLGCGVFGFFIGFLSMGSIICLFISMFMDPHRRRYWIYIIVPIVISLLIAFGITILANTILDSAVISNLSYI